MNSTAVISARLDYMSVKEYFSPKNLASFLGMFLLFVLVMDTSAMGAGMLMMAAFLFSNYPFLLSEKNNSDILYASLPLSSKNLVTGRYLYAISLFAALAVIAALLTSLCAPFVTTPLAGKALLGTIVSFFALFSILTFIQIPIFFKVDYGQAKMLAYVPILLVAAVPVLLTRIFPEMDVDALFAKLLVSPPATIAIAVLVWLAILAVSLPPVFGVLSEEGTVSKGGQQISPPELT